jgi:hypothetical protein
MENLKIEKTIWTEDDFDEMGWHDTYIHAISIGANYELVFDIDYIFKSNSSLKEDNYFSFWISPCTLVFENVHDLRFDIEVSEPFEIQISDMIRSNPQRPANADFIKRELEHDWVIETQQGEITFTSVGFKQYVRKKPMLQDKQVIDAADRGGISFNRVVF